MRESLESSRPGIDATALTSVIKEAEELRLYARPEVWLTLEERAELVRQGTGRDEPQRESAKRIDLMLATDNLGFLPV